MCKLSIITVNLNNSVGLRKTIESVLRQSFDDYEYIIIDGGSTDGSRDVIEEYEDRIDFWVSEPDKGIYDGMNKGILHSNGEYLLFLNSGDYMVNDILEKIAPYLLDHYIYSGSIFRIEKNGRMTIKTPHNVDMIKRLSTFMFYAISHQSTFIRKEVFDLIGLYGSEFKVISDQELFYKAIFLNNLSYSPLPEDLIISYYNTDGFSSQGNVVSLDKVKLMKYYLDESILQDYLEYYELLNDYNFKFNITMRFLKRFKLFRGFQQLIYNFFLKEQPYDNRLSNQEIYYKRCFGNKHKR
jgi:glycosyltransferase involved in cell wall biosynthesis